MKLLITGSTGFVGRNLLLHALQDPTWSQIILPVRNRAKLIAQLNQEGLDLDQERLHLCEANSKEWQLSSTPACNVAIHCAGLTFSREYASYFKTNVDGSLALLKALPEKCRLIVVSSQSAAGPTPSPLATRKREHLETPLSWYGESKLAMEKKLLEEASADQLLILRPPMILGPRDTAILPLFSMARSPLRLKPGLQPKEYSWIAIDDLCTALLIAAKSKWPLTPIPPYFIASNQTITDLELLQTLATILKARGITLRLPHFVIRAISFLADKIPTLHQPLQSLGKDRVKEILVSRWIIDGSDFQHDFNWKPEISLRNALEKTAAWLAK